MTRIWCDFSRALPPLTPIQTPLHNCGVARSTRSVPHGLCRCCTGPNSTYAPFCSLSTRPSRLYTIHRFLFIHRINVKYTHHLANPLSPYTTDFSYSFYYFRSSSRGINQSDLDDYGINLFAYYCLLV